MRLNPDCIRDILLQTENGSFSIPTKFNERDTVLLQFEYLKKYSYDEVEYHLNQCKLMNFVFIDTPFGYIDVIDLSPEGHQFLANIRNNNIWKKTKNIALSLGIFSLSALRDISVNLASDTVINYFKWFKIWKF